MTTRCSIGAVESGLPSTANASAAAATSSVRRTPRRRITNPSSQSTATTASGSSATATGRRKPRNAFACMASSAKSSPSTRPSRGRPHAGTPGRRAHRGAPARRQPRRRALPAPGMPPPRRSPAARTGAAAHTRRPCPARTSAPTRGTIAPSTSPAPAAIPTSNKARRCSMRLRRYATGSPVAGDLERETRLPRPAIPIPPRAMRRPLELPCRPASSLALAESVDHVEPRTPAAEVGRDGRPDAEQAPEHDLNRRIVEGVEVAH